MLVKLPEFSQINPTEIEANLIQVLSNAQDKINTLKKIASPSWASFAEPMQRCYAEINDHFSIISHLSAVMDTAALRTAYQQCLPKLSTFYTENAQDEAIYQAYVALRNSDESKQFSIAQKRVLDLTLQQFELAGVGLENAKKTRFKTIKTSLSELSQVFSNHVLDATAAWFFDTEDKDQLRGIPAANLTVFAAKAEQAGLKGYRIGLDMPSYLAVITYAEDQALRQCMYEAFLTKASSIAPNGNQFDNGPVMESILQLKKESADLLGFEHYAAQSLAPKMAEDVASVEGFLLSLAEKAMPAAKKELAELSKFAKSHLGLATIAPYDFNFVKEQYLQHHFALSEERIRGYFPIDRVLQGLFTIVGKLFDVQFEKVVDFDCYHRDVLLFKLSQQNNVIAYCYLDLYARDNKRGGAWMADATTRIKLENGEINTPVAFLTCNFRPAQAGQQALLSHNEVLTLFHEFGHGLHHMLTRIDIGGISGISGVEWDAVELPSQFLENFCWQSEGLRLISAHIETKKPLPADLLANLLKARNFTEGLMTLRQIEFALFDIRLHALPEAPKSAAIQSVLDQVRSEVSLIAALPYNRFQNSFSHIFAGGYAAGYYSYKWAEVLSSDAFSAFEETSLFDRQTGARFLDEILSKGGARAMMDSFVAFRGRQPDIKALLRHSGLLST